MTDLQGRGIFLITTQPFTPIPGMPAVPGSVEGGQGRVQYFEAAEDETTVDAIVSRVVGPELLGCSIVAIDDVHALAFAMNPNVQPVDR